jgi:uncharacterized protein YecT (DUF1311 family)
VRHLAALLVLAALAPLPARADCDPNATQMDLNQCAGAAFEAADKELNALYQQMRHRLADDPDTTHLLTVSQRAWVAWRDAECDFASASVAGGSIYPMIRAQCLTERTEARVADFSRYLACEEGDLSCPLPPAQ